MRLTPFSFFPIALIAIAPGPIAACEGECIVGITKAFLKKYDPIIHTVFSEIGDQIAAQLLPNRQNDPPPISYLKPILTAYTKDAYDSLETAIFPSYFHGKCQRANPLRPKDPPVDPPGCPNPDCPVVCGTPGSLVHFYSTLKYIVYNETQNTLEELVRPGTEPFAQVEKNVGAAIEAENKAVEPRAIRAGRYHLDSTRGARNRRAAAHIKQTLTRLLAEVPSKMETACGGTGKGSTRELPGCSWEKEMKQYILSFP